MQATLCRLSQVSLWHGDVPVLQCNASGFDLVWVLCARQVNGCQFLVCEEGLVSWSHQAVYGCRCHGLYRMVLKMQ